MAYISNTTKLLTGQTGGLSLASGAPKVTWGINVPKTSYPLPSFNTANTTPQTVKSAPLTTTSAPKTTAPTTTTPSYPSTPATGSYSSSTPLPFTSPQGTTTTTPTTTGTKGLVSPSKTTTTTQAPQSQFSGFLSSLLKSGSPTAAQNKYLLNLANTAGKNAAIGEDARATTAMYGNEIARVGQLGAGAVAGHNSTGSQVVGSGNAAIASASASNRINALSAGLAAELQGTQQQFTGLNQEANAYNNALTGANTQQQTAVNAYSQGANIAAPSPAQYGQTVFDPATGQFTGGNLDPQTQASSLAQNIMSGRMTYDQALASLGYAGQAGANFLNNAITSAGGNPLQLQAQGAGQQANISTQTTAGTDIARQGLGEATQQYVKMNTAAQFANQQASAVSNILEQTGLNNISSTDYNKALNNLKGRFSDVNFASLNTALQEAQIAYTNLLSQSGGTPTGREAAAINTLNIDQSASAINASIKELESAVARRLEAQYGALQQYNQNLGGGPAMGATSDPIWNW